MITIHVVSTLRSEKVMPTSRTLPILDPYPKADDVSLPNPPLHPQPAIVISKGQAGRQVGRIYSNRQAGRTRHWGRQAKLNTFI
jgi:hypothetical protein